MIEVDPVRDRHEPASRISKRWPGAQVAPDSDRHVLEEILGVVPPPAQPTQEGQDCRPMLVDQPQEDLSVGGHERGRALSSPWRANLRANEHARRTQSMTEDGAKVFGEIFENLRGRSRRRDGDRGVRMVRAEGCGLPGDSRWGQPSGRLIERSIGRPWDSGPKVMTTSLICASPGVAGRGIAISRSWPAGVGEAREDLGGDQARGR